MFKFFKDIIDYILGTCGTCEHEKNCPHIKYGHSPCWDNSFAPRYKKKKDLYITNSNQEREKND